MVKNNIMKGLVVFLLILVSLITEGQTIYRINAANDGQTINLTCPIVNTRFADSGSGSSHYSNSVDQLITFCAPAGKLLKFDFGCGGNYTIERIDPTDTLFIYDGNSTSSPLLYAVTGNSGNSDRLPYFGETSSFSLLSPNNCITFRLKSDVSNNNDGWDACISCVDPISCNNNTPASDLFGGAPYICNVSGYCGTTSGDFGEDYPVNLNPNGGNCPSASTFLGTIENNSWLKFIADSTTVIFDMNVPLGGGCSNGIQTAIFSYNGNSLTRMSVCALSDGSNSGNFQLTGSGLTVGDTYYIMTDGNAGDVCDYTINVIAGVNTLNAGLDQEICSGDPLNLSAIGPSGATYTWNSLDGVVTNASGANQTFNPIVATTYVVEVSGGGICVNQTDTVKVTMCVPLPVKLLGFSAECKADLVELNWQTGSEINNDYFQVEKSIDGINFVTIGSVSGAGNSNIINTYFLQDFELNNGLVYYRLKQVDFNGDFSYSDLIALNKCDDAMYEINNTYFNQFNEIVIEYEVSKSENVMVGLFDVQGKLIEQNDLVFYQNQNQIKVPIRTTLSDAIYMVRVVTKTSVDTKKIIRLK